MIFLFSDKWERRKYRKGIKGNIGMQNNEIVRKILSVGYKVVHFTGTKIKTMPNDCINIIKTELGAI